MPRKSSFPTITDQFCGAGGSSQGAKRALAKHGTSLWLRYEKRTYKLQRPDIVGEKGLPIVCAHFIKTILNHVNATTRTER